MGHASNYSDVFSPTDEQYEMDCEQAEDYDAWCKERDMEVDGDTNGSDAWCAYCGDRVDTDQPWTLFDGELMHQRCLASQCDVCNAKPGDLVKQWNGTWRMLCDTCGCDECGMMWWRDWSESDEIHTVHEEDGTVARLCHSCEEMRRP